MGLRSGLLLAGVLTALVAGGCSSSTTSSTSPEPTASSASKSPIGGNTLPPVVLTPSESATTVTVGTVVTFNMGDPGPGEYVAVSSDPSVFEVTSVGRTEASATFNAGGTAKAAGTATVNVSYRGATNGVGTPTAFSITVTG